MSKRTDTYENNVFQGTITITSSDSPIVYGYGDLECEGTIYTDSIIQNTGNQGVNLEDIVFNDSTFTMNNTVSPNNPNVFQNVFYTEDSLLKSKDSSSVVTVYQPTNSKGDLITHDGTTQIRLPIGVENSYLVTDSSEISGIKWSKIKTVSPITTLLGTGVSNKTGIISRYIGSFQVPIYSMISKGSAGIFFTSKSNPDNNPGYSRFSSIPSGTTSKFLKMDWNSYQELSIYKDYNEGEGDYKFYYNENQKKSSITLTGTTWVPLTPDIIGAYNFSITSNSGGPCASIFISKNDPSLTAGVTSILSSSKSISDTNLSFRWLASGYPEVSKNSIDDDGEYFITNNFQEAESLTITLTGTSLFSLPSSFFRFYQNKSVIGRVYSTNSNYPSLIFTMAKGEHLNSGAKTFLHSPGKNTNEKLEINWNIDSLLSANKTGANYDGNYIVELVYSY